MPSSWYVHQSAFNGEMPSSSQFLILADDGLRSTTWIDGDWTPIQVWNDSVTWARLKKAYVKRKLLDASIQAA